MSPTTAVGSAGTAPSRASLETTCERSGTGFGAYAPELPGVGVVGDTIEEVERLAREAVELHLASLREHGEPIPEPSAIASTAVRVPAA